MILRFCIPIGWKNKRSQILGHFYQGSSSTIFHTTQTLLTSSWSMVLHSREALARIIFIARPDINRNYSQQKTPIWSKGNKDRNKLNIKLEQFYIVSLLNNSASKNMLIIFIRACLSSITFYRVRKQLVQNQKLQRCSQNVFWKKVEFWLQQLTEQILRLVKMVKYILHIFRLCKSLTATHNFSRKIKLSQI